MADSTTPHSSGNVRSDAAWSASNDQIQPSDKPDYVIGPDGERLTLDDLPKSTTTRWVMRRKASVVAAVRGGLIDLVDACARWNISVEEYESWERLIDRHGVRALRATRLQHYR
jgi:hypothetical protein